MRDCKNLRSANRIFFVNDCVWKALEMKDAQTGFTVWATLLIFDK